MKNTGGVMLALVACVVPFVAGCDYHGDATVGCSNIGKLQTGMGVLNTPRVLLGNFIIIDPKSKKGGGGQKLVTEPADVEIAPEDSTTDISDASGLNITFSGTVPSSFQVQLQSQLAESIQLHMENAQRHQIDQLVTVLNRPANLGQVLSLVKQNADQIYLLVWAGVTATNVTFQLKNGTQNSISLNLGKDSFSGSVNYSCQGDLSQKVDLANTKSTLSFFKVMQVVATADGNALTIKPFAENLGDYDFSQATF